MEQAERKRGPKTVKYGGFPEPVRVMQKQCELFVAVGLVSGQKI